MLKIKNGKEKPLKRTKINVTAIEKDREIITYIKIKEDKQLS